MTQAQHHGLNKDMMNHLKKHLQCLAFAAWACCPAARADTTVRDQAMEGKTSYHALVISHGCENPQLGKMTPVKAQSMILPTLKPIITRADTGETLQWTDVVEDDTGMGLAGRVELIQDRSIFKTQYPIYDGAGNRIGFYGTGGNLQVDSLGLVPFRFAAVTFVAGGCARRLLIKLAVADICSLEFPPKPGTAGLWIPSTTTRFRNPLLMGNPAVLIVNRDLVNNPLPVNAGCGTGFDVTVTPSAQDVDASLPFKGWGRNR
jgi:hypothetical protein